MDIDYIGKKTKFVPRKKTKPAPTPTGMGNRKAYRLKRKVTYGKAKGFFSIYDARTMNYVNTIVKMKPSTVNLGAVKPIPLRVISDDGIEVTDDMDVNVTDLYGVNSIRKNKHYFSSGYGGITFKIKVLFKEDDIYQSAAYSKLHNKNKRFKWEVRKLINTLYYNLAPVRVVTKALDIPNGTYVITNISSKSQTHEGYTTWELEFSTWKPVKFGRFANNNKNVRQAIRKANAKAKSKGKTPVRQKLRKCNLKNLKYSKKKTANIPCVRYMQRVLYAAKFLKKSQIDGWYGWNTAHAVKKFQKKYKKQYGLKITGQVDKKTFKALCEAKL